MRGLKILDHLLLRAIGDTQRLMRALIAQMRRDFEPRIGDALAQQLAACRRLQGCQPSHHLILIRQIAVQLPFSQTAHIGQPHAIGREYARKRMDHHPRHTQRFGH